MGRPDLLDLADPADPGHGLGGHDDCAQALGRMERRLVESGKKQGDIPSEASKRAETLVRLLRQLVMIVLWVMACW
jgi:hypothetical protein